VIDFAAAREEARRRRALTLKLPEVEAPKVRESLPWPPARPLPAWEVAALLRRLDDADAEQEREAIVRRLRLAGVGAGARENGGHAA
jgi:hypothetical protein